MGEKGNVADLVVPPATLVSRLSETSTTAVTSTVVQTADTLRDKVVGKVADVALDEVHDRWHESRETPPTSGEHS